MRRFVEAMVGRQDWPPLPDQNYKIYILYEGAAE